MLDQHIIKLDPFPKNEKRVYGKVIELEKNKDGTSASVEITLLNEEMIKYDVDIYGHDGFLENILKYHLEPNDSNLNNIAKMAEMYINGNEYNWLINRMSQLYSKYDFETKQQLKQLFDSFSPYFYEFSAVVSDSNTIETLSKYYDEGSYFEFKLFVKNSNLDNSRNKSNIIIGDILFSASPIQIKASQLEIVDPHVDIKYRAKDIICYSNFETKDNVLDSKNNDEVSKFHNSLDECLPNNINTVKFTFYNVGQGLCSYISFNRNMGIFFDVGFSRDANKDTSIMLGNDGSFNKYKTRIPKAIVLSHWDIDHILGVVYCNKEVYNRKWIAPNINEIKPNRLSNSALRLSKYLSLREKMLNLGIELTNTAYKRTVFLISKEYNDNAVFRKSDNKFVLHKGKGTATVGYSNKENNIGLILELKNDKTLLLTGDVDYKKMPASISKEQYDFLQVPHHGADVGSPKFKPVNKMNSIAIVPVSIVNRYNHPKYPEHLDILRRYGFRIHRTDIDGDFTDSL